MKKINRRNFLKITGASSAALAAAALVGCSDSSTSDTSSSASSTADASSEDTTAAKIKVGYDIYYLGNSWSVQLYEEFKWNAETNYADELEVSYVQSDNDITKQISNMEDLIAQGVDVIITTPCDTTALNSTLQDARDAGIKVILLAAAVDGDCYDTLITVDEEDFGATGAQWLADQLNGEGKIIMLEGISGYSTSTLRQSGAMSVFENCPNIEILADEDAAWDYATAKTVVADLLAAYPEINGVWSQGGAMTLGAMEAFQAAGRDLVPMTGEDNNGYLRACVENSTEGIAVAKPTWLTRVAIECAIDLMAGVSVEVDNIYPVATISGLEAMQEAYFPDLSDDVWCGTELPADVLAEIFA